MQKTCSFASHIAVHSRNTACACNGIRTFSAGPGRQLALISPIQLTDHRRIRSYDHHIVDQDDQSDAPQSRALCRLISHHEVLL
jgi:hypothetical protein